MAIETTICLWGCDLFTGICGIMGIAFLCLQVRLKVVGSSIVVNLNVVHCLRGNEVGWCGHGSNELSW